VDDQVVHITRCGAPPLRVVERDLQPSPAQPDEPGADLAVALAIASAARGVPTRAGVAAFGEIGLTGRLRPAAQAERRLEECAKLGLSNVIAPEGTTSRGGPRVTRAETLRQALAAGLEQAVGGVDAETVSAGGGAAASR